jgi:ribokinase
MNNINFLTIGGLTRDISLFTEEGTIIDNHRDPLRQELVAFEYGAKISTDRFFHSFGGGAANSAVCLANFGLRTSCLGAIGKDNEGAAIVENLKKQGIDISNIQVFPKEQSGLSFIIVMPTGERTIFMQRGANIALKIGQKEKTLIKKAKNIYLSSLSGNWKPSLRAIFSSLPRQGAKVFWNPSRAQIEAGADPIIPFMTKTKALFLNQDEATELVIKTEGYKHLSRRYLDDPEKLLRIIRGFGPEIIVITMGANGAVAFDGLKIYRRAALKEKKRVDATGIGDIFNSSFAAGLEIFAGNIDKSLDLALRNAKAKIGHRGAHAGLLKK